MHINVEFFSYFKELTGCSGTAVTLPPGSTVADLFENLAGKFPKLEPMRNSILVAVGLEYQRAEYRLHDGDAVSLFPPVQGG